MKLPMWKYFYNLLVVHSENIHSTFFEFSHIYQMTKRSVLKPNTICCIYTSSLQSNYVTYFPLSSRYSPTFVAKSIICSKMPLQFSKCFLYFLWALSTAILLQNSSSFLISSARSNLACWARAYMRPQSERGNQWRRYKGSC